MSPFSNAYVEALQTYYDSIGKTYNDSTRTIHQAGIQRLLDTADSKIKQGDWVLDLATGTGNVAFAAAAKVGDTGHVLGVDISDELLGIAEKSAHKHGVDGFVKFVKADVGHLELPERYSGKCCFDSVTCGSAIAMFTDPAAVLSVVAEKYLRPGGVFVADMYGTHVPAKVFLDIAVQRGFQSPMDPIWLSDIETGFHNVFENSKFELKQVKTVDIPGGFSWDVSTPDAIEKLWQNSVVDSTWVSFGMEKMSPETISEIKQTWIEILGDYRGSDGLVSAKMRHCITSTVLKSA